MRPFQRPFPVRKRWGSDRRFSQISVPRRLFLGAARRPRRLDLGVDFRGRHEGVAVGHSDFRQALGIHLGFFFNDLVQEENVGHDGVHLIVRQHAGAIERHGSVDVVPQRCSVRPVAAHRFERFRGTERIAPADESSGVPAFRVFAVAFGAAQLIDFLALDSRSFAGGEAGSVRRDGDIPGANFLVGSSAPDAVLR